MTDETSDQNAPAEGPAPAEPDRPSPLPSKPDPELAQVLERSAKPDLTKRRSSD